MGFVMRFWAWGPVHSSPYLLNPQPQACPVVSTASIEPCGPVLAKNAMLTWGGNSTLTGVSVDVIVPSPSSPYSLLPHASTPPLILSAYHALFAVATWTMSPPAVKGVISGTEKLSVAWPQ